MFPPAVGGTAVLFHNVYSRLADLGVCVVTDRDRSPGMEAESSGLPITRVRIDPKQRGVLSWAALKHHWALARSLRSASHRATIVHCGRAQPEGLAARLASAFGGPPYVFWAHGEEIASSLTSRHFTWAMRLVHRGALAAIANSRHTASLLSSLGMPDTSIRVAYPGVDPDRFSPGRADDLRRRWAPEGALLLLTVGRLQLRKGHDTVIRAMNLLRADTPPVHYVIVGDGEERASLGQLVKDLDLSSRVQFAGPAAEADLPAWYRACDIFVHPNRMVGHDFEGFGIVFLEAAASEKPAIGGDTGGVPEAIAKDTSGLLVGGADPAELAAAIRTLAASPELRARMGRTARERVLGGFTWRHTANEVRSLHEELQERRGISAQSAVSA